MKFPALIILLCLLLSACSDNDLMTETSVQEVESNAYFPLQVGNYWLYQVFEIDELGNEQLLPEMDTIEVKGETLINNETYFTISDGYFNLEKLTINVKDSLGYLVDSENRIRFASSNFTDILHVREIGPSRTEFSMEEESVNITVPNGEFECLNYKGIVTHTDPSVNYPLRELNNYYSENIGLISSNIFYFSSTDFYYERRLIEYFVQ